MPTITETTEPYEVLIRFENGAYKGAHFQAKTVLRRDGVIINESLNAAVPIKGDGALEGVISQVLVDQDAALLAATADLEAANLALSAAEEAIEAAVKAKEDATAVADAVVVATRDEVEVIRAELIDVRGQLLSQLAEK